MNVCSSKISEKALSSAMRDAGKIIMDCRKDKGLSRTALSDLCGVPVSQLRSLEAGTGKVSMLTCLQVAEVLNIRLSKIIKNLEESFEVKIPSGNR